MEKSRPFSRKREPTRSSIRRNMSIGVSILAAVRKQVVTKLNMPSMSSCVCGLPQGGVSMLLETHHLAVGHTSVEIRMYFWPLWQYCRFEATALFGNECSFIEAFIFQWFIWMLFLLSEYPMAAWKLSPVIIYPLQKTTISFFCHSQETPGDMEHWWPGSWQRPSQESALPRQQKIWEHQI